MIKVKATTATATKSITSTITIVLGARFPFLFNYSQRVTVQSRPVGKIGPKI